MYLFIFFNFLQSELKVSQNLFYCATPHPQLFKLFSQSLFHKIYRKEYKK